MSSPYAYLNIAPFPIITGLYNQAHFCPLQELQPRKWEHGGWILTLSLAQGCMTLQANTLLSHTHAAPLGHLTSWTEMDCASICCQQAHSPIAAASQIGIKAPVGHTHRAPHAGWGPASCPPRPPAAGLHFCVASTSSGDAQPSTTRALGWPWKPSSSTNKNNTRSSCKRGHFLKWIERGNTSSKLSQLASTLTREACSQIQHVNVEDSLITNAGYYFSRPKKKNSLLNVWVWVLICPSSQHRWRYHLEVKVTVQQVKLLLTKPTSHMSKS